MSDLAAIRPTEFPSEMQIADWGAGMQASACGPLTTQGIDRAEEPCWQLQPSTLLLLR